MDCPAAQNRLLYSGVPATVEHGSGNDGSSAKHIAETVQNFITLMDALKLAYTAIDMVQPLVSDLVASMQKTSNGKDSTSREKMQNWLVLLNQRSAAEELNEEEVRQLLYDADTAYGQFHQSLSQGE